MSTPVSPRLARLLRRIRLALFSLVVLALAGEIAIRVYEAAFADGEVGALTAFVEQHDDHWRIEPGARVIQTDRFGGITYSFNSQGFRDREHANDGPGRRVLFLGDSISFGLEVEDDEPFPRRIEQRLNSPGREPVHVMNLGIFAYTPTDELAVFRHYGAAFRPEVVVLQLYMNDFVEALTPTPTPPSLGRRLRAGWHRLTNASALYRRLHQVANMIAYQLIHEARRVYFPETLNDSEPRDISAFLAAHPDDEKLTGLVALEKIRDAVRDSGALLLVFLSPNEVQLFRDDYDGINERIAARSAALGLDFADPLPMLRGSDIRERLFSDGLHFSPEGHELITDWLRPQIELLLDRARTESGRGT